MTIRRSARRSSTAAIVAALLALAAAAWPALVAAADRSQVVIHAVVLAVDPARNLVMLHHEALETEGARNRVCRLSNRHELRLLTRGTVIEATAETSHDPWILEHVRVRARVHIVIGQEPSVAI